MARDAPNAHLALLTRPQQCMRVARLTMASPVVINSSSPTSIRLPSITPPSRRDNDKHAASSSPGLPSPSTFTKPKVSALKSGSRAQAIPSHVGFGFATASSLLQYKESEAEPRRDETGRVEAGQSVLEEVEKEQQHKKAAVKQTTASGKLRKPQKVARAPTNATAQEARAVTPNLPASPAKGAAKSTGPERALDPLRDAVVSRRPSLDLSEYAFGVYNLGMQTQAPPSIAPANPRKRTAKPRKVKEVGATASRPRKGKAKSEAVILDSDEPDEEQSLAVAKRVKTKPVGKHTDTKREPKRGSNPAAKSQSDSTGESDLRSAPDPKEQRSSKHANQPTEKSAYFSGVAGAHTPIERVGGQATDVALGQVPAVQLVASNDTESDDILAAPRRTDWTPVKDTVRARPDVDDGASGLQGAASSPKLQLADVLGGFGFVDANTRQRSVERAVTGEAPTKRRRIELADTATAPAAARKAEVEDDSSAAKQTKKPSSKKKLQTITALATAAYQPAAGTHVEQSIVSEFFAAKKETARFPKDTGDKPEKPKKPRKPRTKKAADSAGDGTAAVQPKKVRKTKVKFSEEDHTMKLYSPARAEAQMRQQDFLFGTSSQLAVDESPTFIRDMQAAVHASEIDDSRPRVELLGSQIQSSTAISSQALVTPRRSKSCAKVPTAPHGTCLSLGQAQRELWCVSSRDHNGGFLRELPQRGNEAQGQSSARVELNEGATSSKNPPGTLEVIADERHFEPCDPFPEANESNGPHTKNSNDRSGIVDLVDASTLAHADAQNSAIALDDGHGPDTLPNDSTSIHATSEATAEAQEGKQDDIGWMLISSDEPEHAAYHPSPAQVRRACPQSGGPLSSGLVDRLLVNRNRGVLQPLDANAGMLATLDGKSLSLQQPRSISMSASDPIQQPTAVRPRGRPRKNASNLNHAAVSPKRRGRPPKRPVIALDPSPEAAKFKKPDAAGPASQQPHSPSGWLDVDEISDSDSPTTPSPPRRRATSTPPAIPPLDIAVDGSPLGQLKDKASAVIGSSSTIKPGEPQWAAIRDQLFPKISATIKDVSISTDPSAPSWYQKILMYDPIVLEDLTAWLNKQGLRIQLQKQKPKIKKRGRKKKGADEEALAVDAAVEWETYEECLQAWMLQKWCEERSICCVWAGGGWGGRARH